MDRARIAIVALAVSGCGAQALNQKSPIVQIAQDSSPTARSVAIPFLDGQNGTQLVYQLLVLATQSGADRVSDIAIEHVVHTPKKTLRCRTELQVGAAPSKTQPFVRIEPAGPTRRVTRLVDELEYRCARKTQQIIVYGSKEGLGDPVLISQAQCDAVGVKRYVSRPSYQLEAGYVPADLEQLSVLFSDRALHRSPPRCVEIPGDDSAGATHRITARIFRKGDPAAPSAPSTAASGRPTSTPTRGGDR